MKRIFMTGGTGFIGSFLAVEFLKRGYELVILARGRKDKSAQARIDEILAFVDPEATQYRDCGQYHVVEGDVTKENLGIADSRAGKDIDAFFHVAASTDFSEKNRDEIYRTNFNGVSNVLQFCENNGIKEFHHTSTLFVAGQRSGIIRENELNCGQGFANPYESSKMFGEGLVCNWGEEMRLRHYKIYRLPVVCGDTRTGKTTTFTGLYGFLAPFWMLKNNLIKRFQHDGHRFLDAGISVNKDGVIKIPLTVEFSSSSSSVELIPVDWVIKNMVSLFESETRENQTFHLAHRQPPLGLPITMRCIAFMGIEGVSIVDKMPEDMPIMQTHPVLRMLQKNVDSLTERFREYTNNHKLFDSTNVRTALGENYLPPPEFDDALLKRLVEFAMERGFRNLF